MAFSDREGVAFWMGRVDRCYLGYASDPEVRENAASGGAVSAVLIRLLESGRIDGALVSRITVKNGRLQAETFLARTREEILSAQTSIYFDFPVLPHILRLRDKPGRYAVVALPCQLSALKRMDTKYPILRERIPYRLGLWCGHTTRRQLLDAFLERKGIDQDQIDSLRYHKGHWRGRKQLSGGKKGITIRLKYGREIVVPFLHYGVYQNLWLCCAKRCLACPDHFAEAADISFGDAWLRELRSHPVKHSLILSRSVDCTKLLHEIFGDGSLVGSETSPETLLRSQRRSLIYHKRGLAGRHRVGPLFGMRIPNNSMQSARWNDLIGAFLFLSPVYLSKSDRWVRLILRVPRVLLYPYIAAMKLMINY